MSLRKWPADSTPGADETKCATRKAALRKRPRTPSMCLAALLRLRSDCMCQLERFRAKWIPVRVKKTRQNKNLEPGSNSIRTGKALACGCATTTVRNSPVRNHPSTPAASAVALLLAAA